MLVNGSRILRKGLCGAGVAASLAGTAAADPVALKATYYGDAFAAVGGGNARGLVYAADLDASLTFDAGALVGWRDTSVLVRGFANNGASVGALTGDAIGVNNWETGLREIRLLEASIDHEFAAGRVSLRAGLYDISNDFDASKTDALFLNNGAGTNPPLAASGRAGPSTFPATSLGARLRWKLDDHWTLKAAALDGAPGDPEHPGRTVIALRPRDGALLLGEVRYHDPGGHRVDIGYWRYTAAFERLDSPAVAPLSGHGEQGVYAGGDIMLFHRAEAPLTGLSLGARIAHADPRFARVVNFVNLALTYNDLRIGHDDRAGLALFCAETSAGFRQRAAAAGAPVGRGECTVEATYRYALRPWLLVQPDVQYVVHPTFAPGADHATVVGLRIAVSFDSTRPG